MANPEHLKWLKEGVEAWNARRAKVAFQPDLIDADLTDADISGANLRGAKLSGADLRSANLEGAYLIEANHAGANLIDAKLFGANVESLYSQAPSGSGAWEYTELTTKFISRQQLQEHRNDN